MRLNLASCWQNIELDAERSAEWLADSSALRVHWQSGPLAKAKPRVLTLLADGANDVHVSL